MGKNNQKKFQIKARQYWEEFVYEGNKFPLNHLNAHKVIFAGHNATYEFVVTYGLHCFTKDNQKYTIAVKCSDSAESRSINLERYELSKGLRKVIQSISEENVRIFETSQHKHFFLRRSINLDGQEKQFKVCICLFKENRLMRLHVTSVFFEEEEKNYNQKSQSIFKLALDLKKAPRNTEKPKEALRS